MDSMTDAARGMVVGVDAHTDTHDACVLDDCGRMLATRSFSADSAGYRELLRWVGRFGPIAALGVESTGSYAAGLVRHLRAQGLEVLEVNQPHPHTRRRRGQGAQRRAQRAGRPDRHRPRGTAPAAAYSQDDARPRDALRAPAR